MSDTATNPAKTLSNEGGVVQDVKFYYRPGCTKADLDNFREKAWAQINRGTSQPDTDTDW